VAVILILARCWLQDDIKAAANEDAAGSGAQVLFTNDPKEAVEGADVGMPPPPPPPTFASGCQVDSYSSRVM
jgi:hypothetical protein